VNTSTSTARRRRTEKTREAARLTSAVSMEHGTPREIVDFVRYVLGGRITTDPASSAYWNHHSVKADVFYDRQDNGLTKRWHGGVIVNAPGSDEEAGTETLVRPYWEMAVEQWQAGVNDGLVWIGYSVQQVGMLQGSPSHPLVFPTIFPCERFRFLCRPTRDEVGDDGQVRRVVIPGPPVPGDQPMHFNYLSLLPSRRFESDARAQVARFRERGASLGALTRSFAP
jgi:hypothetical protein